MDVGGYDPFVPPSDPAWDGVECVATLDGLLDGADAVSVHVPLVPETRHLISHEQLDLLAPGAVVVNTSRGGIVDEVAVVDALRSGRLGGAALDVFAAEPVDAASGAQFVDVPNLILTPHIAGITVESNERVSELTAANVRRSLQQARP
jgi:(S)-sulfolactate dehydrogenase